MSLRSLWKYDISAIPLGVTLGDDFHHDGVDVTAQEIFSFVDKTGVLPKTSAISMGEYTDFFKPYLDAGYAIIHINISSDFSICYQNACLAARELGNVYPVDSRNLSTGSGHLALCAAEMAQQGMDAEAIAARATKLQSRVNTSRFVLQTLEYLKKGGRCSSVVALGANLLSLRPEIEVTGGKMQVGKKYRGKMEKSILDYVRGRLQGREDIETKRIFITHSYVPQEIVDKVVALIQELQPFTEILETKAGCTVSSHCGPNCLGVLFLRKEG
ncbi:MAG: DegV family protein [Oscillospiraceae bacterium]